MTKIKLINGGEWSLSAKTKAELDRCLEDVKNYEMDLLIVVDGKEGVGKSFSARGLAYYCATYLDSSFNIDDIEFDINSYVQNSLSGGKFKINVLDEGRKALGRAKRTREVSFFLDYLSECRSKQQVHIILVPAFHDLSGYIVRWRMRLLFHFRKSYVKNPKDLNAMKNLKRGEFKLYSTFATLNYEYENRTYKYPKGYADWNWWSSKEVFSSDQIKSYNDKKDFYTLKKYGDGVDSSDKVLTNYRRGLIPKLESLGFNQKDMADFLGVNPSQVSRSLKMLRAKDEYNITYTSGKNGEQ